MNKQETMIDAVKKGKQLRFMYSDKWREVSPHKVGIKYVNGVGSLRVFGMQFDGRSHDGELVEGKWRCFKIEDCKDVKASYRDGTFHTEETAGGPNFCMDEIIAEVSY